MAEVIASTLIEAVFRKLANEALKQVARAKGIRSELKNLGKTLSDIQHLLIDASDKEVKEVPVQKWLISLQHLAYDIDDILDDLATEAIRSDLTEQSGGSTTIVRKLIPSCCTNFSLSTKIHHRLDDINNKLQDLEKEKVTLGLTMKSGRLEVKDDRSEDKNRKSQTSLVDASRIVGRQGDKDALVLKLLSTIVPETLPSLLSLGIWDCPNLKELPVTLLHSLLNFYICRCPDLKERCRRGGSYWPQISHIPRINIDWESQT